MLGGRLLVILLATRSTAVAAAPKNTTSSGLRGFRGGLSPGVDEAGEQRRLGETKACSGAGQRCGRSGCCSKAGLLLEGGNPVLREERVLGSVPGRGELPRRLELRGSHDAQGAPRRHGRRLGAGRLLGRLREVPAERLLQVGGISLLREERVPRAVPARGKLPRGLGLRHQRRAAFCAPRTTDGAL